MIGSVVPKATVAVVKEIRKKLGIKAVVLDWKMVGLPIGLKKRSQIGVDRLVDAAAAKSLYGFPVIVIDFGTATTFCVVDKKGVYRGGAITSGLAISRDVLHERTAKLPLVDLSRPERAIGEDTESAMRSGLFFGYVELVEGMVRRFRKEMGGRPLVIATGGLAKLIASGTRIFDRVDQDLTLKGLNIIYNRIAKG